MPSQSLDMYDLIALCEAGAPARPRSTSPLRHTRHIRIDCGDLRLDYQAGAEQARQVADELARRFPEFAVTIDDELHPELPPLPCAGLWD